jgi:hypothetical protein
LKIAGSYTLALSRDRAYQALQDPEMLARVMPGCESLEKIGEDEYRMKMKMVLASLSGAFEGKVRIADRVPPSSFRLIVEGSGKVGFVKGDGLLQFKEGAGGGDSCEVSYEGELQVGGTIAAVGQRLIDSSAKMMIRKFFETLAEEAQRHA